MTAPVKERGTRRNLPLHFRSAFPFPLRFRSSFLSTLRFRSARLPKFSVGKKISHEGGSAVSGSHAETF